MEQKDVVPFRLNKLQTLQFAIFDEIEIDEKSIELETGLGFGIDSEQKVVGVNVKFSFHSRKTVFLLIELRCEFLIRGYKWEELITGGNNIVLPQSLIGHLTVLTIGAVRGHYMPRRKEPATIPI